MSFTVESKLLFHPHILPQPGGLLLSSPFCPQEENQKLAEGWGQCVESSNAFDASHPHFVLSPAPPLSVLQRGLEAASCSWTERRLPPPCKSLQRMSEGQKFSTPWVHSISQVAALRRLERKGPGRWNGLWPMHSALPCLLSHSDNQGDRGCQNSAVIFTIKDISLQLCFSNCVTPKRDLVWCLCICKSHSRGNSRSMQRQPGKTLPFPYWGAAELPGSSRTSPRSYVSWMELETSSCSIV